MTQTETASVEIRKQQKVRSGEKMLKSDFLPNKNGSSSIDEEVAAVRQSSKNEERSHSISKIRLSLF